MHTEVLVFDINWFNVNCHSSTEVILSVLSTQYWSGNQPYQGITSGVIQAIS